MPECFERQEFSYPLAIHRGVHPTATPVCVHSGLQTPVRPCRQTARTTRHTRQKFPLVPRIGVLSAVFGVPSGVFNG